MLNGLLPNSLGRLCLGRGTTQVTITILEEAICRLLNLRVSSLQNKVFAHHFPQNVTLPAACVFRDGTEYFSTLRGLHVGAVATIQIDVKTLTRKGCLVLGDVVRQALQGFSGGIGDVTIDSITTESSDDVYESPDDGEFWPPVWHKVYDFHVLYQGAN